LALGTAAVLGLFALRTIQRNPVWRDNDTLFTTMMMEHPESGRSQWVLGNVLLRSGDVDGALRAFRHARGFLGWPGNYVFEFEAGDHLLGADRPREAIDFLEAAHRLDPLHRDPLQLLAVANQNLGRWEAAAEAAGRVLALDDANASMHHLRATALEEIGRPAEAVPHRERVLELSESPGWLPWVWLARAQRAAGDTIAACRSLESALGVAPGPAERATVDSLRSEPAACVR
jgi:tetratricopeptide (TPR) repeat protein